VSIVMDVDVLDPPRQWLDHVVNRTSERTMAGMAARIVPKTHLRDRIRGELANLGEDTMVITDRGAPIAVLVSVDRWNTLQESLAELQDTVAVFEHRANPEAAMPAEEVFAAIEADHAGVRRSAR
jgi:prevent-host-death family protein